MISSLSSLTECIAPQLLAVDEAFRAELKSDLPCVNTLVKHVSRFRGKMLRPILLLLSGRALGELSDAHITLATVVEMVHMATLVHDDVLDEAELRRKGATIKQIDRLENYGRCLGIAFQIQDDILDLVGEEKVVGKTLGIDLEKQKLTLPIIHFLESAPSEHRALLRSLLQSRESDKLER